MFVELIATFVAGLGAAGVMMLIGRLAGGRLPRWLVPVAAGLGMLATTISNEYGWYDRTRANLPEGVVIAQTVENQSFYRPWTYMAPYVDRFVAVDEMSLRRNAAVPEQRMVDLFFFGRWAPVRQVPVLMDCADGRRANLIDGVEFDDEGAVANPDWISVASDDPVLRAVCEVS